MENSEITGSAGSAFSPLSQSSPVLSADLLALYGALTEGKKRLFRKMYTYLWRYLLPLQDYSIMQDYWALHQVLTVSYPLAPCKLALLSWLYQASARGKLIIDSRLIRGMMPVIMAKRNYERYYSELRKSGYITRFTRDPSAPYLLRSVSRQPIFIKVTSEGCKLIENIERDTYNLIMRSVMREITTGKPKRKRRKKP